MFWQAFVVDPDQIRRLMCRLRCFGYDERHAISHMAHTVERKDRTVDGQRRGASISGGRYDTSERLSQAGNILSGQDGKHAGHLPGGGRVDGPDARVGMR